MARNLIDFANFHVKILFLISHAKNFSNSSWYGKFHILSDSVGRGRYGKNGIISSNVNFTQNIQRGFPYLFCVNSRKQKILKSNFDEKINFDKRISGLAVGNICSTRFQRKILSKTCLASFNGFLFSLQADTT